MSSLTQTIIGAVVLLVGLLAHETAAQAEPPKYKVPNPFQSLPVDKRDDFYLIRSTQSTYSSHKQHKKLEVEDYFSLGRGISYSIHRNQGEQGQSSWALIGDGKRARWYIIRNVDANDGEELECELDQVHSHRQVFPWQFVYNVPGTTSDPNSLPPADFEPFPGLLPEPSNKKSNKTKSKKSKRSFLYGVGAIWLNVIKADVRSDLVGEHSPYQLSNSWQVESKRLKVELLFDKPAEGDPTDLVAYQQLLDAKPLASVKIDRKHLVENAPEPAGGSTSVDQHSEYIVVEEFKSGLNNENSAELLDKLATHLEFCRKENEKHRLFPSLLRAISVAPQHLYKIDYLARYMPLFADGATKHDDTYDERRRRYLHALEMTREVFSMSARTELLVYDPVQANAPGHGRTDVYLTRFAEGKRATRHSTSHFHMILMEDSETCEAGGKEPHSKHRLLQRPFHFHKEGQTHLAHVRGLGALLMNAADLPYKTFGITRKTLEISQNPLDLEEKRAVEVEEWRVEDKHSNWLVSFFIERRNNKLEPVTWNLAERAQADLKRLVRVDVRDTRAVDLSEEIIDSAGENRNDDYNLLLQFTITSIDFELPEEEEKFFTTTPEICLQVPESEPNGGGADSSDDETNADEAEQDRQWDEQFSYDKDYESEADASESESAPDYDEEVERFEFDPDFLDEDFPLPDFVAYLEDETSYRFVSRLELLDGEEGDESSSGREQLWRKHIWMSEAVDLETERATLSVFNSDEALKRNEFDERYLVLYESELMFRQAGNRCQHVADVESKWLRLFSDQWVYHTLPNFIGQPMETNISHSRLVVESSSLSLFGVGALWRRASESGMAEFLGRRRETIVRGERLFKQLVWSVLEFDMNVHFNFLMPVEEGEQHNKDNEHLLRKSPERILSLDSITMTNELPEGFVAGHFKQVRAASISFLPVGPNEQTEFLVPKMCRDQFVEGQRMREVEPAPVRAPSPSDVLGPKSAGYYLHYIITHTASVNGADPNAGLKASTTQVAETFDREQNRAKILVTFMGMTVEIYVDGQSKRMFAFSSSLGQCSAINALGPVFKTLLGELLVENSNFEPDKFYGLAGLWAELAAREARARTDSYLTKWGEKQESRIFRLEVPVRAPGGGGEQPLEVELTFRRERRSSRGEVDPETRLKVRPAEALLLRMIRLRPIQSGQIKWTSAEKLHKTTLVYVDEELPYPKGEWQLPPACEELAKQPAGESSNSAEAPTASDKPDGPPKIVSPFPKIGELLARLVSFHMKSEISFQGEVNKVYVLDEWTHNNHLRMRSRGLGKAAAENFDFLVYADTGEQFDLSKPFKCEPNHYPPNVIGSEPHTNILETLLAVNSTKELDRLASLYYGPMALWRLAERHLDRAELVKTVEIAPEHLDSADSFLRHIERELRKETWRISAPESSLHKWAYSMEFLKYAKESDGQGSPVEWHVLESIQVEDIDGVQIFVDVATYDYEPRSNDFLELFRLPEGWGCKRSETTFESYHEFEVDWNSNWHLTYEASLELLDVSGPAETTTEDLELGPLLVNTDRRLQPILPTLSGSFMRSISRDARASATSKPLAHDDRSNYPKTDLNVHLSSTRFLNGSSQLTRLVADRNRPIEFELDEATGACSISRGQGKGWQLEFDEQVASGEPVRHVVRMLGVNAIEFSSLFQQLFLNTVDEEQASLTFTPLNKFSDNSERLTHTTYEREFENLRLTNGLVGPARVVRRYDHARGRASRPAIGLMTRTIKVGGRDRIVSPFSAISTRVFLFSHDKTKLQAIFDMSVRKHPTPRLGDFLAAASISSCFNNGEPERDRQVAHFTLEYPMREFAMRLMARYYLPSIVDNHYANLLSSANLMALQLDGEARADLSERDHLLRLHFNVLEAPTAQLYFNERHQCAMSERVESASETRLAANLLECSRWCDQINCLAFSYCEDRTCRVATSRALFGSGDRDSKQDLDLDQCDESQTSCSYYHNKLRIRTRSLGSFGDFMERIVNARSQGLDELKLFGLTFAIYPQVTPTRFYQSPELFRWAHERDEDTSLNSSERRASFGQLRTGVTIDSAKLALGHSSGLLSLDSHAQSGPECFDSCLRNNCLLVSHCKRSLECRVVMAPNRTAASINLRDLKREILVEAPTDCSVLIRDHLDEFERFARTLVPLEFTRQLDGYSALECAAACLAAGEACLSFDLCTPTGKELGPSGSNASRDDSTCFLQSSHVTLDSFDRAVLLPPWDAAEGPAGASRDKISGQRVVCDHFSKSLLMSFRRVPNKKRQIRARASLKGISAERCAADCLRESRCQAFEHCLNERSRPMQSCYLIKSDELSATNDSSSSDAQTPLDPLKDLALVDSKVCSIYVTKSVALAELLDRTFGPAATTELEDKNRKWFGHSFVVILLMLVALLLGAAIQFAHIKLTGRPLLVR